MEILDRVIVSFHVDDHVRIVDIEPMISLFRRCLGSQIPVEDAATPSFFYTPGRYTVRYRVDPDPDTRLEVRRFVGSPILYDTVREAGTPACFISPDWIGYRVRRELVDFVPWYKEDNRDDC